MSTVSYPSSTFPGTPGVSIDVPEGWEPVQAPGTTLAARAAVVPGSFTPNVVVSVEHRPAGFTTEVALDELRTMAGQRQGDVSEAFDLELDGRQFTGCDVSWPDPDVERILQAHLFTVLDAPSATGMPFIVQVTGSVGGPAAEDDYALIQEIMATIEVRPWAAAEGTQASQA